MKKRFLGKSLILTIIAMSLCVMSISGCGRIETKGQADKLERSVREYFSALRWGLYREAISYHATRDDKIIEVDIDRLERIEVARVDIISKTIIPSSEEGGINEAVIEAELSYFLKDQGTLREVRLSQIWWYNAEIKHWLIESDFPEFK